MNSPRARRLEVHFALVFLPVSAINCQVYKKDAKQISDFGQACPWSGFSEAEIGESPIGAVAGY
jgi:hypothetical protein